MTRVGRFGVLPAWTGAWARDSFVILASQPLTVVATSLVAILVARELSPADWAYFSAFLGLALGFAILIDLGLTAWLIRELARIAADSADEHGRHESGRLLSAALTFNAGAASALALIAFVAAALLDASTETILLLGNFVAYVGLLAMASALEARLRALRRVGRVTCAVLLEKLLLLILIGGVVVLSDAGVNEIAVAYPVAGAARLTFSAVSTLPGVALFLPSASAVAQAIRASAPFALSAGALTFIPRLDTIVLLSFSTTSAAYIALAERVVGPALLVPVVLSISLYPFIARSKSASVEWRLVGVLAFLGLLFAIVGIFLAPFLIPFVFGEKYRDAIPTVQVFMLILPFAYATNVLLAFVYSARREVLVLVVTLGISLVGTGAVVVGQAIGGATTAAAGVVLRQALFTLGLIAIGFRLSRASEPSLGRPR